MTRQVVSSEYLSQHIPAVLKQKALWRQGFCSFVRSFVFCLFGGF